MDDNQCKNTPVKRNDFLVLAADFIERMQKELPTADADIQFRTDFPQRITVCFTHNPKPGEANIGETAEKVGGPFGEISRVVDSGTLMADGQQDVTFALRDQFVLVE